MRISIHKAAKSGDMHRVKALLDRLADVNARGILDDRTPLHEASLHGHTEIAALLLDRGADVNARDDRDRTPLHEAALQGHIETVKLLLDRGAAVNTSHNDLALLNLVACSGYTVIAALLLERGADVKARDKRDRTPLHVAAAHGRTDITALLLARGADANARDSDGRTPLQAATENGHTGTAELLRDPERAVVEAPGDGPPPEPIAQLPDDPLELVRALEDLRDAVVWKMDYDSDITARAFTSVKSYWRARRWADLVRPGLRVLQGTLTVLARFADWRGLAGQTSVALDGAESVAELVGIGMMLHGLQEAGGRLAYALDGPPYASSVEAMLNEADATQLPLSGFDPTPFQRVIKNHIQGVHPERDSPILIVRKSTDLPRRIIDAQRGTLWMRKTIMEEFDELISEVEEVHLPEGFPTEDVVSYLDELRTLIIRSSIEQVKVRHRSLHAS